MDEHPERLLRRTTFDAVPEQYEAARPTYSAALLDDLVELARIPPRGRVLEIGPGTGKATVALAERGLRVLGVELGERLAAGARGRLAAFPEAEIVVADFEGWEPEEADFDAVVAFTALHWIAPELRFAKPARLVRPGGGLAVVAAQDVLAPGTPAEEFWRGVLEDYETVAPHPDNALPPPPDAFEDWSAELEASGVFAETLARSYPGTTTYTADEYIAVIQTHSRNLVLRPEERRELFARIHARVAARGSVRLDWVATLNVGRTA